MFTSVRHPEPHRLLPLYAVEVTAAAASLGIPIEEIRITPGFLHLGPRRIPSKYRELPINFLISQNELSSLPFWQVLRGNIPPELVRDKLVFIGDNREITHDVHLTPLGQTPGVVIGINGFLTLVTQRHWKEIPLWITLPAAVVLTMGIVLLTFYGPVPWSLLAALAVMVLAVGLEFFLICRDFSTEFFSPLFLIGLAWLTGFSYKYGWLVASAIRLQRQAITDSFTGAYTARYFHLRLQEELHRSRMGKLPISLILIQIASPSQLLQSQPLEVVEGRIRSLVHTLREGIPEGTFLARLQEDRLGALLPKTSLAQATRAAEKLKESLRSIPEAVAFSVACTDQGLGKSADTVLRCAEAALSRASSNSASFLQVYDPSVDKVPLAPEGETPLKKKAANLDYVASELEERNRALENSLVELRKVHKELESAFLEVTKSLVLALETKDAYTAGHLERVSRYSTRLAQGMGLSKEEVEAVQEAALLHDIGKIGLPDEVLHKVGKLTDEEREIIKQHLMIGAKILEPMEFFKPITTLIYHHHEWYDGNGYPHGLAGDFIPPGAQIISIADAFDAMTTHRGYNKPLTPQEAVDEIKRCSGTQFNPVLVDKFSQIILQEGPHLAGHKAA